MSSGNASSAGGSGLGGCGASWSHKDSSLLSVPGLEDTSGSVMSELMALFTPPGRDAKRQQQLMQSGTVQLHPYYKRPGKGHNHDSCDACGEGGDLICCDNCPASFHFSCHAPPLEELDIPMGDWICLRCYVREFKRLEVIRAASSEVAEPVAPPTENLSAQDPGDVGQSDAASARQLRTTSTIAKKQLEKADKEKQVKIYKLKYEQYLKVKPKTNSPFDALIAAAQVTNAEQFRLPSQFESRETLPFSWKWSEERAAENVDLETYPRACSTCQKTSRGVPSIACDFCPLVFHLDCLEPPLCDVPKDRWMCPNHVEHFVDSNLLTSTSLSERLKLWQRYARTPVDTDTVRLEFFRKVRSGKLFQRSRVRVPCENRVRVPQFIKDQYARPLPGYAQDQPLTELRARSSDGSMEEFISQVVSLQTSVLGHQMSADTKWSKRKRKSKPSDSLPPEAEAEKVPEEANGRLSPTESVETASNCSLSFESDADDEDDDELGDELREKLAAYISKRKAKSKGGSSVSSLAPIVRDFLAMQKLRDIFGGESALAEENVVQARAAIVPLHVAKQPTLMRYRTLNIGLGAGVQLDLASYGHCNFVSARHACIYFDQYSQVYELINYSEHGTVVDNAVYAMTYYHVGAGGNASGGSAAKTKKLDKRRLLASASPKSSSSAMSSVSESRPCYCGSSSAARMMTNLEGCENSAILHHGSYIRMGCIQFVFSVMDYLGEKPAAAKAEESEIKEEKGETDAVEEQSSMECN